jgi:hypothetical protein
VDSGALNYLEGPLSGTGNSTFVYGNSNTDPFFVQFGSYYWFASYNSFDPPNVPDDMYAYYTSGGTESVCFFQPGTSTLIGFYNFAGPINDSGQSVVTSSGYPYGIEGVNVNNYGSMTVDYDFVNMVNGQTLLYDPNRPPDPTWSASW